MVQFAVPKAIGEVNDHPNEEPAASDHPSKQGQARHHGNAS